MVLGLITTKRARMEAVGGLRKRIFKASGFFPLERLGLSPQCGFASSVLGNKISPRDQRRKLELVVRTARSVWG